MAKVAHIAGRRALGFDACSGCLFNGLDDLLHMAASGHRFEIGKIQRQDLVS